MQYLAFSDLRAKLGGRARSSIYLDVVAGRLPPPIKLGGRLYWRDEEVEGHLRNAPVAGSSTFAHCGSAAVSDEERRCLDRAAGAPKRPER